MNRIFEEHKNKINLVLPLQLPIPKPNKMKGPTKNHRPRKYSMRKILLTLTLQRMKDKVGNFLSQFQSAYRNNCWTTDIIQVFRFIDAKAVLY